jgi:hypothetical protein
LARTRLRMHDQAACADNQRGLDLPPFSVPSRSMIWDGTCFLSLSNPASPSSKSLRAR